MIGFNSNDKDKIFIGLAKLTEACKIYISNTEERNSRLESIDNSLKSIASSLSKLNNDHKTINYDD